MHENPAVRVIGKKGTGARIVPGMVITIEPVLSLGSKETVRLPDTWGHATRDGSLSAQFEHTVAVSAADTANLTFPEGERYVDFPPFF